MEVFLQDNLLLDNNQNPDKYEGVDQIRRRSIFTKTLWDPIRRSIVNLNNNVIYKGVGFDVDPNNDFAFPILKGSVSTYNSNSSILTTATNITLVGGYQSRHNS